MYSDSDADADMYVSQVLMDVARMKGIEEEYELGESEMD